MFPREEAVAFSSLNFELHLRMLELELTETVTSRIVHTAVGVFGAGAVLLLLFPLLGYVFVLWCLFHMLDSGLRELSIPDTSTPKP